jgi:hypothetical protein
MQHGSASVALQAQRMTIARVPARDERLPRIFRRVTITFEGVAAS